MTARVRRAVLAYSGGLDTSIIIPWLKETYGCEVIAMLADVGQGQERAGLERRAIASGADCFVERDLRAVFVEERSGRRCEPGRCTRTAISSARRWRAR